MARSAKVKAVELDGGYDLTGSFRLVVSTGAVTGLSARSATNGHVFSWRWADTSSTRCFVRYVGARFTLTTAYGTPQETGLDMIMARSYTASHTSQTAVDTGSTVANTNKLLTKFATSKMATAGLVRISSTSTLTAGTHTFDANPISIMTGWSGAIGDQIPVASARTHGPFGTLFDARIGDRPPIVLAQDEGFVLRNVIAMGATGVGRWDICVEWDEGIPHP